MGINHYDNRKHYEGCGNLFRWEGKNCLASLNHHKENTQLPQVWQEDTPFLISTAINCEIFLNYFCDFQNFALRYA